MDGAMARALEGLQPYPYGWRSLLPASARFFGLPVALEFETRPYPEQDPAPAPSGGEVDLAALLLAEMPELLATCERRYATYNADFPDVMAKIDRPRVWICREMQERDGPDRWSFVVGISDAADWSVFVEFRGPRIPGDLVRGLSQAGPSNEAFQRTRLRRAAEFVR
jgi:hypothetical protein